MGEPDETQESSTLSYTYYGLTEETTTILTIEFDRNTSGITNIAMEIEETERLFAYKEDADGEYYFPYKAPVYQVERTPFDRVYLYDMVEGDCITEINSVFLRYYNGEMMKREYAETIVPVLESCGYYDALLCAIFGCDEMSEAEAIMERMSHEEVIEYVMMKFVNVDLEDEINAIYYGPLFEMLP